MTLITILYILIRLSFNNKYFFKNRVNSELLLTISKMEAKLVQVSFLLFPKPQFYAFKQLEHILYSGDY